LHADITASYIEGRSQNMSWLRSAAKGETANGRKQRH
jgi:hypothetical protein